MYASALPRHATPNRRSSLVELATTSTMERSRGGAGCTRPRGRRAARGTPCFLFLFSRKLAQHVLQNPAVLVVLQLLRRADADQRLEPRHLAVVGRRRDGQLLGHFAQTYNVVALLAREAQRRGVLSGREL